MRQIALKRRVGALFGRTHLLTATGVSDEWSQLAWWRRMLLPADFKGQVQLCQEETLECRKFTTEYLLLKESQKVATIQSREARTYHRDLDHHPREFRNQRLTFIANEEKLKCSRCGGRGRTSCSPEVRCPSCKGRRTRVEFCFTCGGSGRAGQNQNEQCWSCRGRGTRSEDCAACAGVYSSSTGRVTCRRCGGMGWVVCRTCAGAGEKVRARLVTRNYTCSAVYRLRLGCMDAGRLKNGLARRHFKSLTGDLVHRELQAPSNASTISQRLSVFSYAVNLRTYRYKETDFYVNCISSRNGDKSVSSRVPWSKGKLSLAASLSFLALSALLALSFLP